MKVQYIIKMLHDKYKAHKLTDTTRTYSAQFKCNKTYAFAKV